jgi:hypothetical protein
LFQKLPLDGSLLSFLVEGALICEERELPNVDKTTAFVRMAIRGQNLDRAGLSSRHMKLMNLVSEPVSLEQLAQKLGWPVQETQRVLHGFELAELIERRKLIDSRMVYGLLTSPNVAQKVGFLFRKNQQEVTGKMVRDWLGLKLLLRRNRPKVLLIELTDQSEQLQEMLEDPANQLKGVRVIGIQTAESAPVPHELCSRFHQVLEHECSEQQLFDAIMTTDPTGESSAQALPAQGGTPVLDLPHAIASPASTNSEA